MELIVAKNRNGPFGTAIAFYKKFTGEVWIVGQAVKELLSDASIWYSTVDLICEGIER